MTFPSRRQLAQYAVNRMLNGDSAKDIARHLGAVLVESRKTQDMKLLLTDIAWELERRGKVATATATSATILTENLRRELTRLVKKSASVEQVQLEEVIDKRVIGGVRVETAIHSWDKTVARRLTDIREVI